MSDNQEHKTMPQAFKRLKLKEIGKIVSGGTPSTAIPEYWNGNINWISPADLTGYKAKRISKGAKSITESGLKNSSARLMPKGTVLFSSRAPIGYVAIADNELASNQGFKSIIPNENVDSEYLYYFLKSAKQMAENVASGTTFKEISLSKFSELEIPVPSKPTQKAIVSKIEELFSELDKGIENLRLAQQQLKTYRQAVLKWAFEGRLTKENVKEGELPEGWKWVRFGEVHEIKSNLVQPKLYLDYPHIAPDNISKGTAKLLNYRTIKEDKVFSPKHRFYKGQIIYSKIRPNLSKIIIAPFDGLCSADMYPIDSQFLNKYSMYYMLTTDFVSKASNTESRTILPKINQKSLNEIPFPLCTITEQKYLVQKIEEKLSSSDYLEELIKKSLLHCEQIKSSILKKAFKGELPYD